MFITSLSRAQFYNGLEQEFGKNRVQYKEFVWADYKFEDYSVYFYQEGRELAIYTAKSAKDILDDLEKKFDYKLDGKVYFLVYNTIDDYRQSNIGLVADESNLGGVTKIIGSKVFVYNEGDHALLDKQIRAGVTEIMINKMMYGSNWKEMLKNSALLTLPDWYIDGLVSFSAEPWSTAIDSRVKDGIMSGRYDRFNRLTGLDSKYAGHLLWNYIAEVYGAQIIPNILYMSRISRNIESGFLFVLGMSLKTLTQESLSYYRKNYITEDNLAVEVPKSDLKVRIKKFRDYTKIKVSPDGKQIAFATNEMGQQKVWIYDVEKRKKKKIYRAHHKLERINDNSYPLIAWNPAGDILSIITERKGKLELTMHLLEEKQKVTKPIFRLEKILAFNYSPSGKEMVFSAIKNGHTDLFLYTVSSNSHMQLTFDLYDDLSPSFYDKDKIIFASNRVNDTLRSSDKIDIIKSKHDLFLLDLKSENNVLLNLTKTPKTSEREPYSYSDRYFSYLSDKSGISNRYVAFFDSAVSHVDTIVHYRHFTVSKPITNHQRGILTHDISKSAGKYAEIFYSKGKHQMFIRDIEAEPQDVTGQLYQTNYRKKQEKLDAFKEKKSIETVQGTESKTTIVPVDNTVIIDHEVDIENYLFDFEKNKEKPKKKIDKEEEKSHFITLTAEGEHLVKNEFVLPNQNDYHRNFTASDILTQLNFDFSNEMYQWYNGAGGYINPGMGAELKVEMMDLFEDYKIEGGSRFSLNGDFTEYFLSYEDRVGRLDKKYTIERMVMDLKDPTGTVFYKIESYQGQYKLKWALNEVFSVRGNIRLRNDQLVIMSTNDVTLEAPGSTATWGGFKAEIVFDNTINKGINLYNGSRFKVFAEYFNFIEIATANISIIGCDFRNYLKIHRNLIWANRFAASSSFGSGKLLYYLGGVDNWIIFSDRPRFDPSTPVDLTQNYILQANATNLRGFLQNVRNGNNFAVINSELRWPIFKYFLSRPIKSDFLANFQVIGFADIGTAWTGWNPYSNSNYFNSKIIQEGPLTITLKNQIDPIVGSYGYGFRSRLWGYFVRLDFAYGIEDGKRIKPVTYLSLGLDF